MSKKIACLICLFLFLCTITYGMQNKHKNSVCVINVENLLIPDSTINGLLILGNSSSVENFSPMINKTKIIDEDIKFIKDSHPFYFFTNLSKTEYLITYQYEGSSINVFSCFEIGYLSSDIFQNIGNRFIETSYEQFRTESGLRLGMTLEEVKKIKGGKFIFHKNKVRYSIDYSDSEYLKRHNMPEYFIEFDLSKNKVVKIKFGFVFP